MAPTAARTPAVAAARGEVCAPVAAGARGGAGVRIVPGVPTRSPRGWARPGFLLLLVGGGAGGAGGGRDDEPACGQGLARGRHPCAGTRLRAARVSGPVGVPAGAAPPARPVPAALGPAPARRAHR